MDAMKHALMKHIAKAKGIKHGVEGSPLEEKAESPDEEAKEQMLGDKAPEIGQHSSEMTPEHMDLLKALLGQIDHSGRDAMTLGERSLAPMHSKLASLGKHKKI